MPQQRNPSLAHCASAAAHHSLQARCKHIHRQNPHGSTPHKLLGHSPTTFFGASQRLGHFLVARQHRGDHARRAHEAHGVDGARQVCLSQRLVFEVGPGGVGVADGA